MRSLIYWVANDPEYFALYHQNLAEVLEEGFNLEETLARIQTWQTLIQPVVEAEGSQSFESHVQDLMTHVENRHATVQQYLDSL